jgi:hypothetical protein
MVRTLKPLILLSVMLAAPPADAASDCKVPVELWELELTRVERLSGPVDPQTIIDALGTRARLRGGYRDPRNESFPPRAELVGSTDGAGLSVSGEKREP